MYKVLLCIGSRPFMDPTRQPKRVRMSSSKHKAGGSSKAPAHQRGAAYKVPGYMVTDHQLSVPLDHNAHAGTSDTIQLFAREVVAPNKLQQQQPYLVYLQGGPGFPATLPIDAGAWLRTATNYFKVILLDQRGTGLSSPISCRNLVKRGTAEQQAEYLKFFRADSIVKDCEIVRKHLVPEDNQSGRWSVLGHSFGGFCAIHYVSEAPEGLAEVLITGGIPPMVSHENPCDEVYMATYQRVIAQNRKYYKRFPQDVEVVWKIVQFLGNQPEGGVRLPSGSFLSPRGLQLLGSGLGFAGGFDRLHFVLEMAWDSQDEDELSYRFLKAYESWMSWETNPLYVLLHESIYTQGSMTDWSAERIRNKHFMSQFDALEAVQQGRPVLFTGEMVFPWMLEDFKELVPLRETAHVIAKATDWGKLYDVDSLGSNSVPVASATYIEDMFVDFNLAQQSAQHIKGMRQWMTNEYMHSGIKDDGARIFEKLLGMARESILLT